MKSWKDCKPGDPVWVLDYELKKSYMQHIEYIDESKFGEGYLSLTLDVGNPLLVYGGSASRCIKENISVYCDWDVFKGEVQMLLDDLKDAYDRVNNQFNELNK